jgi:hypothetical protein
MDGGQTFNSKGSFGIPDAVKKQIEEVRAQKAGVQPKVDSTEPVTPQAEPEQNPEDTKLALAKKEWENHIESSITEDDIQNYIFKGRLIKENIYIASFGAVKLRGTFVTLTPNDTLELESKLNEFRSSEKFNSDALEHMRTLRILSYSWVKANGTSIGDTSDERFKRISDMGAHVVDAAAESWRNLNFLLKLALKEDKLIKKS